VDVLCWRKLACAASRAPQRRHAVLRRRRAARQNFDEVLVPADHVSRSPNDTYYIDAETVLRCHTSAHQAATLRAGHSAFLITGAWPGRCTSAVAPVRGVAGQALYVGRRSPKLRLSTLTKCIALEAGLPGLHLCVVRLCAAS